MSDQFDELHAQAAIGPLMANVALTVFDGAVPSPTPDPPYVVVYTEISRPAADAGAANALDGRSVTCQVRWHCHCVGLTAAAARAVGMQVRSSLLDVRPVIAGRSCDLIRQDEALPPRKDESTGRLVIDAVYIYSLITTP